MEDRWPVKVRPLPWYGGKQRKSAWLHSLIPWCKDSTYIEPFGGMASLLCYRAPVDCEIFNDLDFCVWNWWRVIRDHGECFGSKIEAMPLSEKDFEWAVKTVNDKSMSAMDRALAFHILAENSVTGALANPALRVWYTKGSRRSWNLNRIQDLAERFWKVQLLCRPAEKILARTAEIKNAVIYADPPYFTARTEAYNVCEFNIPEWTELFKSQRGQVAVSGYSDEWDHLGWDRHELEVMSTVGRGECQLKTEVLWTNYDACADHAIGGLFA